MRDQAYIDLPDKPKQVEMKKIIKPTKYKLKSAELFCDLFRTQSANLRREKKFYQEL